MATAVLRSQKLPSDRLHGQTLKSRRNYNRKPNPNPLSKSNSNSSGSSHNRGAKVVKSPAAFNLVMEQVTILKRGEKLSLTTASDWNDLGLCSTERLGPEPETVQKQVRVSEFNLVDFLYAGSGIVDSPPPSSLPFPALFSNKKEKENEKEKENDSATSDLRRLLRLDVVLSK